MPTANGADLRELPLTARKYALEKIIYKARVHTVRLSEPSRPRLQASRLSVSLRHR